MNKIVLIFGCILSMLFCSTGVATAQAKDGTKQASAMPTMSSCIDECKKCKKMCEDTLAYCKKKGGKLAEGKLINRLKDCVASCNLSADYMTRVSASHTKSCGFCAEICTACAVACEEFKDDKQMKDCAEECRRCADSCSKMAKMDMSH